MVQQVYFLDYLNVRNKLYKKVDLVISPTRIYGLLHRHVKSILYICTKLSRVREVHVSFTTTEIPVS